MPNRVKLTRHGQKPEMNSPAYARVICPKHRKVLLSYKEYTRQMALPNELWRCPICGNYARFDDEWFDTIHSNTQ